MVQILAECDANYEHSGAAVVAITFLSIFAVLIAGDAVLSGLAIKAAIDRGRLPLEVQLRDAHELLRTHGGAAGDLPVRRHSATTVREAGSATGSASTAGVVMGMRSV